MGGDEDLLLEYKKVRNKVRRALSKDRSEYYKNKLMGDQKLSSKQSWSVVNNLLGKSTNKSPSKICFENDIISNPRDLSVAFSKIFKNKVE